MVAIPLKEGMSAKEFRQAAAASSDANQARRLLALAAIRDGMSRQAAARIGGMDRQTLRDWVHAFNKFGLEGLINDTSPGRPCNAGDGSGDWRAVEHGQLLALGYTPRSRHSCTTSSSRRQRLLLAGLRSHLWSGTFAWRPGRAPTFPTMRGIVVTGL